MFQYSSDNTDTSESTLSCYWPSDYNSLWLIRQRPQENEMLYEVPSTSTPLSLHHCFHLYNFSKHLTFPFLTCKMTNKKKEIVKLYYMWKADWDYFVMHEKKGIDTEVTKPSSYLTTPPLLNWHKRTQWLLHAYSHQLREKKALPEQTPWLIRQKCYISDVCSIFQPLNAASAFIVLASIIKIDKLMFSSKRKQLDYKHYQLMVLMARVWYSINLLTICINSVNVADNWWQTISNERQLMNFAITLLI